MPGNVAGFAALQGAFGKLPWQRDIARAEQLATTGFAISPALAARLATAQDLIRLDASLASEFLDESGHPKPAGSHVANRELGETLALIRTNGSAGFYRGDITASIAAYVAAQGGAVPTGELAGYRPLRAQASESTFGSATAYLPSPQVAPGNFASALLANVRGLRTENPQFDMARGVGMATARTIDQLHVAALPQDLGSTGFAAVDGTGQAVACAVSMNGPFGSGHTAESTGVTLARAPSRTEAGIATIFLSPIIATTSGTIALVGAGAGGPNGNASLAYTVMRLAAEQNVISSQSSTGAAPYDTFNMIACQNARCAAIADPGGAGLGIAMGK